MTKHEQIEWNLGQIARATKGKWGSGVQAQVKFIRRHLERIEYLLQKSEPESLASSVLRLVNECNMLETENHELKQNLAEMTLNFNAAEKHARQLEEECVRKDDELNVTIRSNIWLRERLTFKDESLRACRAAEKALKEKLAVAEREFALQERYVEMLKEGRRRGK